MQIVPASHIAPFVTNAPSDMMAKGWHSSCTARIYWCSAKHKLDIFHLVLYYPLTPTFSLLLSLWASAFFYLFTVA